MAFKGIRMGFTHLLKFFKYLKNVFCLGWRCQGLTKNPPHPASLSRYSSAQTSEVPPSLIGQVTHLFFYKVKI